MSDSGLGCGPAGSGLHGWPLCQGGLLPADQLRSVLEYTHRALATVVTILLAAIVWQALRRIRSEPGIARRACAAFALLAAQALLGALTVEHGLPTVFIALHLGVAMVFLCLLIDMDLRMRSRLPARPGPASLRGVAVLAAALLLATIVSGGVVAGTEAHGTPHGDRGGGAHTACGKEFPSCNGALLPFGEGEMVDLQLAHRTAMLFAVVSIAALALLLRRHRHERLAGAIALLVATQVWLGALNVWAGESGALVIAHLTVATVLWALVAVALVLTGALMLRPARRPAAEGGGDRGPLRARRGAVPSPARVEHG